MTRLSQVSTMYAAGSRQAAASAQELAHLATTMPDHIETFRTHTPEQAAAEHDNQTNDDTDYDADLEDLSLCRGGHSSTGTQQHDEASILAAPLG